MQRRPGVSLALKAKGEFTAISGVVLLFGRSTSMTCEFRDAVNRLAPLVLSSLLQAAKSAGPNFVASRHVKVTRNQLLAQHVALSSG